MLTNFKTFYTFAHFVQQPKPLYFGKIKLLFRNLRILMILRDPTSFVIFLMIAESVLHFSENPQVPIHLSVSARIMMEQPENINMLVCLRGTYYRRRYQSKRP